MLIICNGMIRSGSTLQYNLVCEVVGLTHETVREGFYSEDDFERNADRFNEWVNDDKYHVVKMHEVIEGDFDKNKVKYIYIFRDIRDVAVSVRRAFGFENKRLIRELDNAVNIFEKLNSPEYYGRICLQKYEAVAFESESAALEIMEFLGLNADSDQIKEACDRVSNMRFRHNPSVLVKIKKLAWRICVFLRLASLFKLLGGSKNTVSIVRSFLYPHDNVSLLHEKHISEALGASMWRSELTPEEVELFVERYKNYLINNDYI